MSEYVRQGCSLTKEADSKLPILLEVKNKHLRMLIAGLNTLTEAGNTVGIWLARNLPIMAELCPEGWI